MASEDAHEADEPDWRSRLIAFYAVYNQEKLMDVGSILEKYRGKVRCAAGALSVQSMAYGRRRAALPAPSRCVPCPATACTRLCIALCAAGGDAVQGLEQEVRHSVRGLVADRCVSLLRPRAVRSGSPAAASPHAVLNSSTSLLWNALCEPWRGRRAASLYESGEAVPPPVPPPAGAAPSSSPAAAAAPPNLRVKALGAKATAGLARMFKRGDKSGKPAAGGGGGGPQHGSTAVDGDAADAAPRAADAAGSASPGSQEHGAMEEGAAVGVAVAGGGDSSTNGGGGASSSSGGGASSSSGGGTVPSSSPARQYTPEELEARCAKLSAKVSSLETARRASESSLHQQIASLHTENLLAAERLSNKDAENVELMRRLLMLQQDMEKNRVSTSQLLLRCDAVIQEKEAEIAALKKGMSPQRASGAAAATAETQRLVAEVASMQEALRVSAAAVADKDAELARLRSGDCGHLRGVVAKVSAFNDATGNVVALPDAADVLTIVDRLLAALRDNMGSAADARAAAGDDVSVKAALETSKNVASALAQRLVDANEELNALRAEADTAAAALRARDERIAELEASRAAGADANASAAAEQLHALRLEIDALTQQLSQQQAAAQSSRDEVDALTQQLSEQRAAAQSSRDEQLATVQARLEECELSLAERDKEVAALKAAAVAADADMAATQHRVADSEAQLASTRAALQHAEAQLEAARTDAAAAAAASADREHTAVLQLQSQVREAEAAVAAVRAELATATSQHDSRVSELERELCMAREDAASGLAAVTAARVEAERHAASSSASAASSSELRSELERVTALLLAAEAAARDARAEVAQLEASLQDLRSASEAEKAAAAAETSSTLQARDARIAALEDALAAARDDAAAAAKRAGDRDADAVNLAAEVTALHARCAAAAEREQAGDAKLLASEAQVTALQRRVDEQQEHARGVAQQLESALSERDVARSACAEREAAVVAAAADARVAADSHAAAIAEREARIMSLEQCLQHARDDVVVAKAALADSVQAYDLLSAKLQEQVPRDGTGTAPEATVALPSSVSGCGAGGEAGGDDADAAGDAVSATDAAAAVASKMEEKEREIAALEEELKKSKGAKKSKARVRINEAIARARAELDGLQRDLDEARSAVVVKVCCIA
jgi:chromosome segregation ATPase